LHRSTDFENVTRTAHEEEHQSDDAEQDDDNTEPDKNGGGPEGRSEDAGEVVQPASAQLRPVLAFSAPVPKSKVARTFGVVTVPNPVILDKYDDGDNSVANGENTPQHTDGL